MIARLVDSRYIYFLIFAFYIIGLWGMSVPLTGDQKVYISVALEMSERGEWIIPYLFNEANFLKPPLQYWATLLGWKLFGLSLFGALIPSVLALLGSAYLTNRISQVVFKVKSNLSGLVFSAGLGSMTYGTTGQMEIWVVLFYLWAWYEFLLNRYLFAFLIVGAMAWVKGPLYPALWVLSSMLYLFLQKQWKQVFKLKYLLSLVIGIAVGLLWYMLAARTHLEPMLDVFLRRENIAKFQTSQGSPQGLWGEFLYTLFPWVFCLILVWASKEGRAKIREHRNFYLSYALIPALFFTFFPYRVNTYLYLLTPIAAMMASSITVAARNTAIRKIVTLISGTIAVSLALLTIRLMLGNWLGAEVALPIVLWLMAVFSVKARDRRNSCIWAGARELDSRGGSRVG